MELTKKSAASQTVHICPMPNMAFDMLETPKVPKPWVRLWVMDGDGGLHLPCGWRMLGILKYNSFYMNLNYKKGYKLAFHSYL